MSVLLLLPGLISFILVWRGRIETAFLYIYLPCLLLLPYGYGYRLPHLPPLSASEFALIPLGIVGLARMIRSRSLALMDILVVLFLVSASLSEILHQPVFNDAVFYTIEDFIAILLSYAVGRQLIEPNLRFATLRMWFILVLLNGPTILYEWRMGQNIYGLIGQKVFGLNMSSGMQFRDGHARIGAVFGGGENAGIAFAMTFCLHGWFVYLQRVKAPVDFGKALTTLEKYHVPGILLVSYAMLTKSRGPEISLAAGYLILQIARFKKTRLMTIVVAVLLVGGYLGTSAYFASYTNVTEVTSEQQSSAVYRFHMNKLYAPIAEKGGWTGYGLLLVPAVEGIHSIDNHYLLVHLMWGRLGYILLVLIVWENIRVLLVRLWQFEALQDRAFAVSMLAAMAVLWLTLLTVFMGVQLPQIAFLLLGWIQTMGRVKVRNDEFSFQRVLT